MLCPQCGKIMFRSLETNQWCCSSTHVAEPVLKPLPVSGYTAQTSSKVALVNLNKDIEERLLRVCDELRGKDGIDGRFLSMAVSHFQEGFMCMNRAVFNPERIKLPEDSA